MKDMEIVCGRDKCERNNRNLCSCLIGGFSSFIWDNVKYV